MAYKIDRVDVWAGSIQDRPGGLAGVLEALAQARVNLEFVVARRDKKGTGVVFVTPIRGVAQTRAAKAVGLAKSDSLQSLRIEGDDRPGIGAVITEAMAESCINLRGMSAAALGKKCVFYFAFDSVKDADKAARVVKEALRNR